MIPRYPPFYDGLPAVSVMQLLASQDALIHRLQQTLGLPDEDFARWVQPVLERYAAFVHLLPASETHHHRGAGGLFRHGLEVAQRAVQAAEGVIFAGDKSPSERRQQEPRWRLAALLAGLCHDIGKPPADLIVSDQAGVHRWAPYQQSLADWLQTQQLASYWLQWRPQRHRHHTRFTLLVLPQILTPVILDELHQADPGIITALLATLIDADEPALANPLTELVKRADSHSVTQDLRHWRTHSATAGNGIPLAQVLRDAFHHRLTAGQWTINHPGARLWVLPDDTYLVWPAAAPELAETLIALGEVGISRDPTWLAERLNEWGIVETTDNDALWRIQPILAEPGEGLTLTALRLCQPHTLWSDWPDPVPGTCLDHTPPAMNAPSPAPESPAQTVTLASAPKETASSTQSMPASSADPANPDPNPAPAPADVAIQQLVARAQDSQWWSDRGWWHEDQVAIGYPQGLQGLDRKPREILTLFSQANRLTPNPATPARPLHRLVSPAGQTVNALLFTPAISASFPEQRDPPPATTPTANKPSAKPTATALTTDFYDWLITQTDFPIVQTADTLEAPFEVLATFAQQRGLSRSSVIRAVTADTQRPVTLLEQGGQRRLRLLKSTEPQ